MKRLLVAGCGDLGLRLARRLDQRQWQITGLRRNVSALTGAVQPFAADLARPDSLAGLAGHWDAVIYQATPGSRDPSAYRQTYVNGLFNLLQHARPERLIFVSSTAVYGQDNGSWVDEDTPAKPAAFNGRILLEAEALAAGADAESVAVRFSGIYGPGREYLIHQLKQGRASCRPAPPQWTNRIHADDCAAVLEHLLRLADPAEVYNASDCRPAERCEVLCWLADRLAVPEPRRLPPQTAGGQGKRVGNRRLLDSGFEFLYPDYRAGYGAMLT